MVMNDYAAAGDAQLDQHSDPFDDDEFLDELERDILGG
jgi:hypothetical protein